MILWMPPLTRGEKAALTRSFRRHVRLHGIRRRAISVAQATVNGTSGCPFWPDGAFVCHRCHLRVPPHPEGLCELANEKDYKRAAGRYAQLAQTDPDGFRGWLVREGLEVLP